MTNIPSSAVSASPALTQLKDKGSLLEVVVFDKMLSADFGSMRYLVEGKLTSVSGDSIVVSGNKAELQISGLMNAPTNIGTSCDGEITSLSISVPSQKDPNQAAYQIWIKVL